ncbi:MAG: DUF3108 domain-containing protein [Sideroxydans sp.]|nr:DUF3108 domain-containing protein [Sideroxydans sp.]
MRIFLALLLFSFSAALWAEEMPSRIEATYDVLARGIKFAEVREVFIRTDDNYRIESVTKPVAMLALFQPETIVVVSEGEIGNAGLHPLKFSHRRTRDTSKNNAAEFDWDSKELTVNDQSGIRQLPLPADTQDRLSVMYQFVANPPHRDISFSMTNGSKLETYRYQLQTEKTVDIPYGTLKSYYLSTPPQRTAWKSEIWLAEEHSFMPCKIVVTEDTGEKLVQVLTSLNIVP